jgi:WS/DGAT/MGAT family acyltransferase
VIAETRLLERLTASDLFLLLWDDYGWSTDIGGVAILDGTSLLDRDGRVRIEAVRRQLEPRLHQVPRFRQLLFRPRLGLGWPLWVDAPSFDVAAHIRVHMLAAPGDEAQLLHACQELARRRLDPARPLWELWLLPGLSEGRVGAFLRLHHVLADGAAALAAFGALLDLTAAAPTPVAPPWTSTPIPTASELLRNNLHRRRQELGRGWSGLAHLGRTLRRARRALPAWQEVLTEQPAPRTSLNHPVGADRRLAIIRGRLERTKQIAHAHNAKVNDVVLAAVAGGLRELLASRGQDVQGLVQRAMVTISEHSASEHTADAAAILEALEASPAVAVGTSAGAAIALRLAVRRPDFVRAAVLHESPWRALRHPSGSALGTLARVEWQARLGRYSEATETLLRFVYAYRDGGSAWDQFPEEWRRIAKENGKSVIADLESTILGYPRPKDLAKITAPFVCTYGSRSPSYMRPITRSLAQAIPTATVREIDGAAHAVTFDAPDNFVRVIVGAMRSSEQRDHQTA